MKKKEILGKKDTEKKKREHTDLTRGCCGNLKL